MIGGDYKMFPQQVLWETVNSKKRLGDILDESKGIFAPHTTVSC